MSRRNIGKWVIYRKAITRLAQMVQAATQAEVGAGTHDPAGAILVGVWDN
jgi:hypothetical protein